MAYSYREAKLPNGLTIVGEVDPQAHTAAVGFFVRTGARDEPTRLMGVSHFLEHMMFKGTADLSAQDLNRAFDALGARNNAYTSTELTCFYAHVLPERASDCVKLLGTMMRPALRESDFSTEKGVILEEIAMYRDNPFWQLYETCVEKHFGDSPLSHRVLGTEASITALARDEMQQYFDARYSSDNTVLALAGRIDFDALCADAAACCATWNRTNASRDTTPPRLAGGTLSIRSEKVHRGYVLAMCTAPAADDERRYAAALLAQILGAPDNSRLHWNLIENGLAEEAQAAYDAHEGFGEFFVYASGEPDRMDEVWDVARKQMRDLRDTLTQEDVDRLLQRFVTGATIGGERPHDRMHRLGKLITTLRTYWPLEEELRRLSAVSLKDVLDLLDTYTLEPVTLGTLTPAAEAQASIA